MSKKITHEQARQHLEDKIKDGNILTVLEYIKQQEKQEKLFELYKQAYDKSNAEVLKMFTHERDEKTTLSNIMGHLDNSETVVKIRELEK